MYYYWVQISTSQLHAAPASAPSILHVVSTALDLQLTVLYYLTPHTFRSVQADKLVVMVTAAVSLEQSMNINEEGVAEGCTHLHIRLSSADITAQLRHTHTHTHFGALICNV